MAIGFIFTVLVVVGAVLLYSYNSEKERVDSVVQSRINSMTVKEKQDEVEVATHTSFHDNSQQNNAQSMTFNQHLKVAQERQDKSDNLERLRREAERKRVPQQTQHVRRERKPYNTGATNHVTHESASTFDTTPYYNPTPYTPSHSSSCDSSSGSTSSYDGGSSSSDSGGSSFSCD